MVASGPGLYTRSGEDAHFLEYRLTFVAGSVVRVEELKNEYEPALESSKFPLWKMPSADERRQFTHGKDSCWIVTLFYRSLRSRGDMR